MSDAFYRAVGRLSLLLDPLRPVFATGGLRLPERDVGPARHDKTGLVTGAGWRPRVLSTDRSVLYVEYDSFAHAFWRAQELSLFAEARTGLVQPVLDFGCGDGSFAAALFEQVEFGVDNDPDALAIARTLGIYHQVIQTVEDRIPLPDGTVGSIFANSVLEHVVNLPPVLRELRRVLAPGGTLAFTVPLRAYTRHLEWYFGSRAAKRVNLESVHRNLFDPGRWLQVLSEHGFRVERTRIYQPPRFTFWYRIFRLLGRRGVAQFFPGLPEWTWRRFGSRLVSMVRDSIGRDAVDGANIFVLAR